MNPYEFASQFEGFPYPMPGPQVIPEGLAYEPVKPVQPMPNYHSYNPKRYQPSVDISASLIRPKPLPQSGYPGFAGGHVPNLINRPNIQNHQPLPIRQQSKPLPSSYHGQLVNPFSASVTSDTSLGSCGTRNAVGIHGRVQNLQYHKASAEFGEYPWQVAILKRLGPADSLYVCGGTLISNLWIATAAHCIKT